MQLIVTRVLLYNMEVGYTFFYLLPSDNIPQICSTGPARALAQV